LRKILDVPNSAILLGGVQTLLDGGRLVFERREPADALVRSLWALLPASSRCSLWPATIVFANPGRFHVVIVPRADDPALARYVDEEQAGDYPEGRYELALQIAVESRDQDQLDNLLARRSRSQVMRLGVALLVVLVLGLAIIRPLAPPANHSASATSGGTSALHLPPASECPGLDEREREEFATRLGTFCRRLGIESSAGTSDQELTRSLANLDARLGKPDSRRDPGPLNELGPLQRQLRALLWKHSVAGYDIRGLNMLELLEKLEAKFPAPPAFENQPKTRSGATVP
jgi:hypothetical protein